MSEYRWGFLGAGTIAHKFATGLEKLPDAVLHSVYSRTHDKARKFGELYGFRKYFKTLDSFLGDPDLDIVYIATPHHLHAEQAIQSMKSGKHVLVEKPLALNLKEALRIEKTAGQTGMFCMEAMWSRFIPVYSEVKKLLERNAIGQIKFFSADFGDAWAYNPDSRLFDPKAGGGSLLDLGVYPISLALMLLGKPESVEGLCRKARSGVDILDRFTFRYMDDAIADLGSSYECRLSNSVLICGERGLIKIPAPIFSPDRYMLIPYTPYHYRQDHRAGFRERLHQIPALLPVLRFISNTFLAPVRNRKYIHKVPFEYNGYQYEALEVMNILDRGERSSNIMPLRDTLAVLEITDRLRSDWGIVFPDID